MSEGATVIDMGSIIPGYVKRLPFNLRYGWMLAFNQSTELYGVDRAVSIANQWVLGKIEELKNKPVEDDMSEEVIQATETINKRSTDEIVSLELEPVKDEMISFSDDGNIILEAVLADSSINTVGKMFSRKALIAMAETINDKGMYLPDIEHETYNSLMMKYPDIDEFKAKLKEEKGLLKDIKAYFKDGKLFIKALLDKRYKNHVDNYKFLSIEALGTINETLNPSVYEDAEPFSFTFTNKPKIKGAEIISARVE